MQQLKVQISIDLFLNYQISIILLNTKHCDLARKCYILSLIEISLRLNMTMSGL